jgi:hypothetical protein
MINLIHIIGFSALTVFVLLKMTKVINWPWIGVLAPLFLLGVIDAGMRYVMLSVSLTIRPLIGKSGFYGRLYGRLLASRPVA